MDYIDELLEEIKEDLDKQKAEAEKILEDINKEEGFLRKWLK